MKENQLYVKLPCYNKAKTPPMPRLWMIFSPWYEDRQNQQTSLTAQPTEKRRHSNTAGVGSWVTFTRASTHPRNITCFCATSWAVHLLYCPWPQWFQQIWVSLGLEIKFNKATYFQVVLLFLAGRRSFIIIKYSLSCCSCYHQTYTVLTCMPPRPIYTAVCWSYIWLCIVSDFC